MNSAQRRLVLVLCLLLAGVFSWWWYLAPRLRWEEEGELLTEVGTPEPLRVKWLAERGVFPPNRPENLVLGIVLPLVLCGAGFFVLLGKAKKGGPA